MKELFSVCLCLSALGLLLAAADRAQLDDYELADERDDYDNFYDYEMIKEEAEKILPKSNEDLRTDKKVADDIEKYKDEEAAYDDLDSTYQIEDNRSNEDQNVEVVKEKSTSEEVSEKSNEKAENDKDDNAKGPEGTTAQKEKESVIDEVIDKDPKAGNDNDYHLLWGDDDLAPLPPPEEDEEENIPEDLDNIFDDDNFHNIDEAYPAISGEQIDEKLYTETLNLLKGDEKDDNSLDELPLPVPKDVDIKENLLEETRTILKDVDGINAVPVDVKQNIQDILDETKKLLEEKNSPNEENIPEHKEEDLEDEISKLADEIDKAEDQLEDVDDDTVDEAMDNLNADLDKLFDTLDKLKEGIEDAGEKVNDKIEDVFGSDDLDSFDDVNDDDDDLYENIEDSNLSEIFAKVNTPATDDDEKEEDGDDNIAKEEIDEVVKEILAEEAKMNNSIEKENSDKVKDNAPKAGDNIESMQVDGNEKVIMYKNDALLGDIKEDESLVEEFDANELPDNKETDNQLEESNEAKEAVESNTTEKKMSTKMVADLTSEELEDLMEQFKLVHMEDLEVKSAVSPVHIKLSVDEPVIVTSPNYPDAYPTNNVIDWLFEGDGMGVEFIVEDFAVNGALGDYLLVKPGGIDASGQDGLVFSYHLNSVRKYRFMDVNRMFVRFQANVGFTFFRGFKFSVRMVSPPSTVEDIHLPEPEELLPGHEENLTLFLGGLSIIDFDNVKSEFRTLLADMAERYIMEHDIDPGLNTTAEVTKIVRTAVCNIRWPSHETCVEVAFAVPLRYADASAEPRLSLEDLVAMWQGLSHEQPFANKLDELGLTEFIAPDDRSVMTAWMVIGFGVLISVAMLALALWRFSCFEDYTRMRTYADTDSLRNEKRDLDLYPTPHQTLPPLYTESEYKWHEDKHDGSTRVHMGGFANKSYIRDDMYGFDSDEDVPPARERYTTDV